MHIRRDEHRTKKSQNILIFCQLYKLVLAFTLIFLVCLITCHSNTGLLVIQQIFQDSQRFHTCVLPAQSSPHVYFVSSLAQLEPQMSRCSTSSAKNLVPSSVIRSVWDTLP